MIEIVSYPSDPPAQKIRAILARRSGVPRDVELAVRDILQSVCERGDAAVAELTRKIDGVDRPPGRCRVPAESLEKAFEAMDSDLQEAVAEAAANIRSFHERQRLNSWFAGSVLHVKSFLSTNLPEGHQNVVLDGRIAKVARRKSATEGYDSKLTGR